MPDTSVALVTGASRGIGRAIALRLAADGCDIVALARGTAPGSLDSLAVAVRAAGRACLPIPADVADLGGHEAIVGRVLEHFGRLDLFVSNAGVAPDPRRDVLEMTPASFDRVLAVNLRGALFLAQKVARAMLEAPRPGTARPPVMVFVTSASAERSSPNRAEYCVSKAGLSMAARVFADRLAAAGITVFEVRPGIIHTDMTAGVRDKYDGLIAGGLVPQGRWGEPDDVARVVTALARGDFGYSTGLVVDVDGGMNLPRL